VGGYIPAGLLPVSTGYLMDAVGLPTGTTLFGTVLMGLAVIGGLVITSQWCRRRSRMAVARTSSPKIWPHSLKVLFEVKMIEPLS
jgi:hypothetical protein